MATDGVVAVAVAAAASGGGSELGASTSSVAGTPTTPQALQRSAFWRARRQRWNVIPTGGLVSEIGGIRTELELLRATVTMASITELSMPISRS